MSDGIRRLFVDLCDDAAVFPPGSLPLQDAVAAYAEHAASPYAPVVGPFVLAANDLDQLAPLVARFEPRSFRLSLTVPLPLLEVALASVDELSAVRLEALEIAVSDEARPVEVVPALKRALADREVSIFVELPRDARRSEIVEALAGTGFMAKLRTGGVRADLYPDEKELAAAVIALTSAAVPFKATAGLHHALRNTDPETGFEQHGFLNLLSATGAALAGSGEAEVVTLLADRDRARVVDRIRALTPEARAAFRSFGTCSVIEPVEELTELGIFATHQRKVHS